MGFWGVMKELYKGSKQVISEVNDGLDKLNAELEAYNAEQRLIKPLKDLKHQIKMNSINVHNMEMAIPESAKESQLLIAHFKSILAWYEVILEAGIEDKNGCRDLVLTIANEFKNEGFSDQCLLEDFLEEYPLEKLESYGYKEGSKEYVTSSGAKIERAQFAYSIDRARIEIDAKNLNEEYINRLKTKLERITERLNDKFNLSLLPLK